MQLAWFSGVCPLTSSAGGTFAGTSAYMVNAIENVPGERHSSEVLSQDVLISIEECRPWTSTVMCKLWRGTAGCVFAWVRGAVGQNLASVCLRFRGRGGEGATSPRSGPSLCGPPLLASGGGGVWLCLRGRSPGRVRPPFARWRLNVMRGGH